jgi:transcriptional regulator GlxA family with amidase domain
MNQNPCLFPVPVSALLPQWEGANQIVRLQHLLAEARARRLAPARGLAEVLEKANAILVDVMRGEAPQTGLAPWQVRRISELVEERLAHRLTVVEMAASTRLSRSAFSRSFLVSFGVPPHGFLMARRIERAKLLMETTDEPLAQIALSCGLADQAHLSRVFRRHTGTTPSAWRRKCAEVQPARAA